MRGEGRRRTVPEDVELAAPAPAITAALHAGFASRQYDSPAMLAIAGLRRQFGGHAVGVLTFQSVPVLRHSASVVLAAALVGLGLVLGLFPDGRFAPRAARWLAPAMAAAFVAFPDAVSLIESVPEGQGSARARGLLFTWSALLVLGLLAQARRYRRVSNSTERQQTKWVMVPLGALLLAITVAGGLPIMLLGASERRLGWVILLAVIPP